MAFHEGTLIGPYEIVGQIGAGGMGEVWKAKDTRLGRDVAIKVLPGAFAEEPGRLKRFEQEARMVAALSHPNVLAIFDVGTHEGSPYLVSELLKGGTLREQLSGGPLTVSKALDIAIQVARGLAAAHDKGIIHRDLKPENIFLTHDAVKILDFGLAKQAPVTQPGAQSELPTRDFRNATQEGAILGTVGYMSPEQVRGEAVDARSDLFALGVVIYEMLSGRQAFHGRTQADTLSAILREDPPELDVLARKVSPALFGLMRHCLEKAREDRFSSAQDLAYALQTVSDSSAAPAVESGETPVRDTKTRRLWPWVAAGLLLVAAMGFLWSRRTGAALDTPITSLAVLPLQNYSGDANQDFFVDGMTDALIGDLGQIKALKVISRTSVMQYKGTKKTSPEIAKELGVQGILEGSVLRSGNRVRISAQLVDARQDRQLWSSNYERDLTDVITLQRDVVREIASQIRVQVMAQEKVRLATSHPVDPTVYDMTLKAEAKYENQTRVQDAREAIAMFQSAVDRDPSYARAWAGLAQSTQDLELGGLDNVSPNEARGKALAMIEKALALDPDLAEAHHARAWMAVAGEWDVAKAQQHFEKALELRPNFALAHRSYSWLLTVILHDFAKGQLHYEKAKELDPFSHMLVILRLQALSARGGYERVLEEGARLSRSEPKNPGIHGFMGGAYISLGKFPEAVKEYETRLQLAGDREWGALGKLGYAYGRAGQTENAQKVLAEFQKAEATRFVSPVYKAWVLMGLGRHDEAYHCMELAFEQRHHWLLWGMFRAPGSNLEEPLKDPRWPGLRNRIRAAIKLPEGANLWENP